MEASRIEASRSQTALLVDDEPVSRKAQQERLEAAGYTVMVAQNQAEALNRARQGVPKVIFLHLVTGTTGNLPLIQALRAEDNCRHIPIVVIKDHVDARVAPTKLRSVSRERW
jgi:CheY-like chemotaxis protein